MGNTRRRFDPEFRAGAVRIVAETGKPVAQVARDLEISAHTLHNWVHADRRNDEQARSGPLNEDEREELARQRARWTKDLAAVAATLNWRPRKTLGWKTPAEALDDHLRSIHDSGVASTD